MTEAMEVVLAKPRGFCAGVDRAIAHFEQAVARAPDHALAHYELGLLYFTEKGDLDRALREMELALALDPEDATARMIYQELLLERGEI